MRLIAGSRLSRNAATRCAGKPRALARGLPIAPSRSLTPRRPQPRRRTQPLSVSQAPSRQGGDPTPSRQGGDLTPSRQGGDPTPSRQGGDELLPAVQTIPPKT